jgi:hypothetical protein
MSTGNVLTKAIAEKFLKDEDSVDLTGFTSIEDDAAKALAQHKRELWLSGLKSLSDAAAQALGQHQGYLRLGGLTSLSDAAAQALGQHKGKIALPRLKTLSDTAAQALVSVMDLGLYLFSDEVRKTVARAQRRRGAPYSSLVAARQAGATLLRSVWNGHGDDGMFEHLLLKDSLPANLDIDPEEDVIGIMDEQGFVVEGEAHGSVGILEVDLGSGDSIFWRSDYQAVEQDRFAEFLMKCEWAKVEALNATFSWKPEEECSELDSAHAVANLKLGPLPQRVAKSLKDGLRRLLHFIEWLEGDGENEIIEVRRQCGLQVKLVVDVVGRTFTFEGRGKQVQFRVPAGLLEAERFKVDLESPKKGRAKKNPKGR